MLKHLDWKTLKAAFCTLVFFLLAAATVSCGDDENGGAPAKTIKVSVSGRIEKGPFVQGSKVTLYELEDDLTQTGKSFRTQTNNDLGAFDFGNPLQLSSQLVELETSGYFYNEVKGQLSASQITLNALSDVANRKSVNVNLITHLEYDRVKKLVKDGLSFDAAKQQAERELLACFSISDKISSPEGISITDNSSSSAMLLAISTIMLYNRSEAEFTEFIAKFSTDFADNGVIDNAAIQESVKEGKAHARPSKVIERMKQFYADKGVTVVCDDFSKYIDFDGNGLIDDNDKEYAEEIYNQTVAVEEIWNTPANIQAVLSNCYSIFQQFTHSQLQLEYLRTKKAAQNAPWWNNTLTNQRITSSSEKVQAAFTNAYKAVNVLNTLIDHETYIRDNLGSSDADILLGQAIALRALAYYNLAMLWGNVPFIDRSLNTPYDVTTVPQRSQAGVFEYALSQIRKAIPMLPTTYETALKTKCLVTRDAAVMMAATILLTQQNYSDAETLLKGLDPQKYNGNMAETANLYYGNIDSTTSLIFSLASGNGLYQPIYTYNHYKLLLKEAQRDTEGLSEEWKTLPYMEYGYWAALKRLGTAQTVTGCQDHELLMPFPSQELSANYNLTQNPGW